MTVPPQDRKRPLGQATQEVLIAAEHKRRRTAGAAVAAGCQMRRRAFDQVFTEEMEPGQAAEHALQHPFPFDETESMSFLLKDTIKHVAEHRSTIADERASSVAYW